MHISPPPYIPYFKFFQQTAILPIVPEIEMS